MHRRLLIPVVLLFLSAWPWGCDSRRDAAEAAAPLAGSRLTIVNPYAEVDWQHDGQYRANFHTHTTESDGLASPDAVIDRYHALGYRILALTDHDTKGPVTTTWPWSRFSRDPAELGMVAIEGNEISRHHHTGSYFSDYGDPDVASEDAALDAIGHMHGLAVFFHPGRYDRSIEWYAALYRKHDHLVGFEVYNQRDRYPGDREKWDRLLTELMPDRPVWGLADDDMHNPENQLGYSWNQMVMPKLDEAAVRAAMEQGRFYFVHAPKGPAGGAPPVIRAVRVDAEAQTIALDAEGAERIVWISRGRPVHEGAVIDLAAAPDAAGYVRAELHGADGSIAGTQPFGLRRR